MLADLLEQDPGIEVLRPELRADSTAASDYIAWQRPDRVVSAVGRTHGPGQPTIDYLESRDRLAENLRDNLYAPMALAAACRNVGAHLTYLGTGCIFSRDDPREHAYRDVDDPDFFGSAYSTVKGFTDRLMRGLADCGDMVLNVRIRMPITGDRHPRNFVTKIASYARVCSVPNSMTVLPTLLPVMVDLVKRAEIGTVNLVNPGLITHNEILDMYREIVDPGFTYENFSIDEQNAVLLSRRSNNGLCTRFIEEHYPGVPDITAAVRACLEGMRR